MTTVSIEAPALCPPTVVAPSEPLGLLPFLFTFVVNPIRTLPRRAYEEPFAIVQRRHRTIVWVTDPALIERVLLKEADVFPKAGIEKRVFGSTLGQGILTAEGAHWRWQRKAAAPAFRRSELVASVPEMTAAAEAQVSRWQTQPQSSICAIDADMMTTTFDVIARTVLGGCAPAEADTIKRAGAAFLEPISWEVGFALIDIPEWVWHPGKRPTRKAREVLRAAVTRLLRARMADASPRHDLLAKLIAARNPETGERMSENQLVDNLATFLMAGHETTAKALTWALYLLARAPDWQRRIHEEVAAVAGNRPIGAGEIDRLTVTQMVIKETMRLYPPAPILSRMSTDWVLIGNHKAPPGSLIVVPIYTVHRHKRLWVDPDNFDPNRFSAEHEKNHARAQFMPFGYGPRTCIGASFAMMEATVLLATFVRAARFDWDGQHCPEPVSRVTLRPKGGMPLKVSMRG
jgi:cytochrome P450